MARIPLWGGRGKNRRVVDTSTVAARQEAAVLAAGDWVLYHDVTGKPRARLSQSVTGKGLNVYLSRFCWELEHGPIQGRGLVDHVDSCDTLNNDVDRNLRLATGSENQANVRMRRNSTSGLFGVSWHKKTGSWQVNVQADGVMDYLGLYLDWEVAARIYDVVKIQLFRDFADTSLNFPRSDYPVDL